MKNKLRILWWLCIACVGFPFGLACLADTPFTIDGVGLSVTIPDGWTAVTPETVANHFSFFSEETPEIAAELMRAEGVHVAAFSKGGDAMLRVIIEQGNDDVALYHDIDRFTPQMRTQIKNDFLDADAWRITGYRFTEAEWSNKAEVGRVLNLSYSVRFADEIIARGRRAYTIRNGHCISLDLQVKLRQPTAEEAKVFANFVTHASFPTSIVMPLLPVGLSLKDPLPEETHKAELSLRGETTGGATLSAVFVDSEGVISEAGETTANQSGAFRLDIALQDPGEYQLFLLSSLSGYADTEISGWINYDKKRIPVTFSSFPTGDVYDSQIRVAGKTISGVSIQCMEGDTNKKTVTGSNGEFSFTLKRDITGPRNFTISFDKEGLDNRRFTADFNRQWLVEDYARFLSDKVQSLSYENLVGNPGKYIGRQVRYTGTVLHISQNENRTYIEVGTKQSKDGFFSNRVLASTDHIEVSLSEGERIGLYFEVTDETFMIPETTPDGEDIELVLPVVTLLAYERL